MKKVHLQRGFVIVLLCTIVLSVWGVQWRTLKADYGGVDTLQPGDILFVDIYEGWCHGGFWDHIALYVGDQYYGTPCVVEATFNGGICLTPVRAMVDRDEPAKVSVRRLKEKFRNEEDIQKAIDYAMAQIGKPFDYTATTSFPVKFNEDNLFCTELVWRAYKEAGIDLDADGGFFVYPDDIYFSPKLEQIG